MVIEVECNIMGNLTCDEKEAIETLRTHMNSLRHFTDIETSLDKFSFTVRALAVAITIVLLYPIVHGIYQSEEQRIYRMFATLAICIFIVLLFIFGSFYGWMMSVLF